MIALAEIALFTGASYESNGDYTVKNVGSLEHGVAGDLTYLSGGSYFKFYETTSASFIFVKNDFTPTRTDLIHLFVEKPEKAFLAVLEKYYFKYPALSGVSKSAFIHSSANCGEGLAAGENIVISAGCVIGTNLRIFHNSVILDNCTIGNNCLIFPNVTIREGVVIGDNVVIHSGAVIGADGFGYANNSDGSKIKIPQVGNVIIEDDVEIGANTTIDRAALGSTIIRKGVKLDNLVQIAHNVQIGENSAISSQSGVSGSSKMGKNCILAGQVGIADHIDLADGVIIAAKSGVSKSIKESGIYWGIPAKEIRNSKRLEAHFRGLPEMSDTVADLKRRIEELEKLLNK
ncbi:MAG: UDP-3-O-(3-hydroxymyristoyl)glucosamine N-acyltransferase [Ignavibacteriaceae bacterium]|nr:UDP-3-O-(3-hydroxymyristoyl)glucosamine N-acyltransferase [Ignavibacteriaceae bacterium]